MSHDNTHEKYCNCNECKKVEDNSLQYIKCPHCGKECSTKKSIISGFKFFGLATAFVAGSYIFEPIPDYPSSIQYGIIDRCIHSDSDYYYTRNELIKKRKVCCCAFDKTKEDIDYSSFKGDEKAFLTLFKSSVKKCSKI